MLCSPILKPSLLLALFVFLGYLMLSLHWQIELWKVCKKLLVIIWSSNQTFLLVFHLFFPSSQVALVDQVFIFDLLRLCKSQLDQLLDSLLRTLLTSRLAIKVGTDFVGVR